MSYRGWDLLPLLEISLLRVTRRIPSLACLGGKEGTGEKTLGPIRKRQ